MDATIIRRELGDRIEPFEITLRKLFDSSKPLSVIVKRLKKDPYEVLAWFRIYDICNHHSVVEYDWAQELRSDPSKDLVWYNILTNPVERRRFMMMAADRDPEVSALRADGTIDFNLLRPISNYRLAELFNTTVDKVEKFVGGFEFKPPKLATFADIEYLKSDYYGINRSRSECSSGRHPISIDELIDRYGFSDRTELYEFMLKWGFKDRDTNLHIFPPKRRAYHSGRGSSSSYGSDRTVMIENDIEFATAHWLDSTGHEWFYRDHRINLSVGWYTPDFYIPVLNQYIEAILKWTPVLYARVREFLLKGYKLFVVDNGNFGRLIYYDVRNLPTYEVSMLKPSELFKRNTINIDNEDIDERKKWHPSEKTLRRIERAIHR